MSDKEPVPGQPTNPLLLAADNSPTLLPLLRKDPSLAKVQDDHGYSLLHAAASYNHMDLARALKSEFDINPNIVDEDGETALFVAETVAAAQCLLEEIGVDVGVKNSEGMTAEDKIREEGEFVVVADYLKASRSSGPVNQNGSSSNHTQQNGDHPPPLPPGVKLRIGSLENEEDLGSVADPALRQRIDELSRRKDFHGEEAQRQLRELITDAVRGTDGVQREVRPRTG